MKRTVSFIAVCLAAVLLVGCGTAVPDVTGMTAEQARDALTQGEFSLGAVSYDPSATGTTWTVAAQSPPAGERAGSGESVDVVLAGAPPVTVPDVLGIERARAESELASTGLTLGAVTESFSATASAGFVLAQTPGAASVVPSATPVAIVVSKGREPVAVPDTAGKTEDKARKVLAAVGFKVKVARKYSEKKKGTVIRQKPSGGRAVPGATVTITVSRGPQLVTVPDVFKIMQQYPGLDIMTPHSSLERFINRRLAGTGLRVSVTWGTDVPGGWGQWPKAGERVPRGTTIKMKVLD